MKIKIRDRNNNFFDLSPTRVIVFSFVFLILFGASLLNLPIMSRDGRSVGFLNALFTSTSASCVTGLVVKDTATQWSIWGQIVILLLIQAGGLGIVTLATFFSTLMRKKIGLKGMILAQESLNYISFRGILGLIKRIVLFTLIIELLGALLLSLKFVPQFGLKGFYMGIFHSVSAFCNAGFDITGSSFMTYNDSALVLLTISGLVIIGGLGFLVWQDLYNYRKNKDLLLHTRVVLIITAFLLLFGTIFFFFFEYHNPGTMGSLEPGEKLNSAFFHSVCSRTAGFNSLNTGKMNEISKVVTILLMFIGAAPGSTGGGVKITTFGVVLMAIISQVKGANSTLILKRRVPYNTIIKALTIMALSAMIVISLTTLILAIEHNKAFIDVFFEATSSFATVGLSSVGTHTLSGVSKVLLIFTMLLGRVGPLTFAISLTLKNSKSDNDIIYPEGKIIVG